MQKVAIGLIVISLLVVGAIFWVSNAGPGASARPEAVADERTRRRTSSGELIGFVDQHGAYAWMGVPFAEPPTSDGRWRAPRPVRASATPREALSAGNLCPQMASPLSGAGDSGGQTEAPIAGTEDCLYLNVWAPSNAASKPVMFWIHGGGNTIGHGGTYIGAKLATSQDVVVVTINYRLGLLGWFSHPALASGDLLDDSGNYGTLDIIQALKWVRGNIAQFGGDPNNITVFGESAGAFDTLAMMASPLAKGLFHRAIVQSGGLDVTDLEHAQNYATEGGHPASGREVVARLLVADGTVADLQAARRYQDDLAAQQVKEYLYGKSAEELYAIFEQTGFGMVNTPDNFGDGHVLPAMRTEEIFSSQDNYHAVPVILGTNRDEPALFMARHPEWVDSTFGVFYSIKDEAAYARTVRYQAQAWKARGVDELAQYMRRSGHQQVYAYRFDWDEEPSLLGFDLSKALGAAHALEIPFVFGDFEGGLGISYLYPGDEAQFALSDSMMSYWSQFAYTGDPGRGRNGSEVLWQPWGESGKTSIVLDSPLDQGIYMTDTIVTRASLESALATDSSFENERERCKLYAQMFSWGGLDLVAYEAFAGGSCEAFDSAQFARF